MPKTNEATDTDLMIIERLQQLGWKPKNRDRKLSKHQNLGGTAVPS